MTKFAQKYFVTVFVQTSHSFKKGVNKIQQLRMLLIVIKEYVGYSGDAFVCFHWCVTQKGVQIFGKNFEYSSHARTLLGTREQNSHMKQPNKFQKQKKRGRLLFLRYYIQLDVMRQKHINQTNCFTDKFTVRLL